MGHRRGDHVFNLGLSKTLEDLARSIEGGLGANSGDSRLWARATRLRQRVEELANKLKGPAFELTVQKPDTGIADTNSLKFGEVNKELLYAFGWFLEGLRMYYAEQEDRRWTLSLSSLESMCLKAELAVSRWTDQGFDKEAAAQAIKEDKSGATEKLIKQGHAQIELVRTGLVDLIQRESPGRSAMFGFGS